MKIFDFFNIKKFLIIKKIKKDYNSILLERVLVKVLRAKRVKAWIFDFFNIKNVLKKVNKN